MIQATQAAGKQLAIDQRLLSWEEVTALWNMRSGESISVIRVGQIARAAEKKLRLELADLEATL